MNPITWPCPLAGGGVADEYALIFDQGRKHRLMIVPALFDEANRMRRLTVEVMRRLDAAGIDTFLVDFPGTNESPQVLEAQGTEDWFDAMTCAARNFAVTHTLGIRGGCLFTPAEVARIHYAPAKGSALLRQMVRTRILSSREAGHEETRDGLMELAINQGINLAGYRLCSGFIEIFQSLEASTGQGIHEIPQDMIGGSGLWLRAEPGESRQQADALAAALTIAVKS